MKKIREDEYNLGVEAGIDIGKEKGREEGKEEGRKEGRKEGIRILVESCQEHGDTKEEVVLAVSRKYSLSLEKAKEYADRFYSDIL